MVVHPVGDRGHASDERDPLGERCELVGLHERIAAASPAGQRAEGTLDLDVGERGRSHE